MWHAMFAEQIPLAEKILRTVIVYALIAVLFRLTGKRGLASLQPSGAERAPGVSQRCYQNPLYSELFGDHPGSRVTLPPAQPREALGALNVQRHRQKGLRTSERFYRRPIPTHRNRL